MTELIVVGLTGGIASGKSTVGSMFERAGALLIDADKIARQVVEPGQPAWQAIRVQFGNEVLRPDGTLDRQRLGDIVFKQDRLRRQLEAIVHPHVRDQINLEIRRLGRSRPGSVVILDVPLLLETGMEEGLAEVIVVYAPQAVQRRRLMQRDGFSASEAQARIDAQMPMEEKRRRATRVIDNSGTREDTHRQTLAIYHELARRARSVRTQDHKSD